ncbi:diguanylate cyclase (GGDEF)-like protein [Aminobacter aminovorans]|uniref:diguanylate cyclase n=1 Tax=Aminobacter aminovorans TaxID=83263 RepID=A0A380WGC1_AMIAI|nr:GGDEF domain-containing protein [Aminobacter aminovorans]TCS26882.1 diguanylate cyclase (GGDEF)-like protein [Aminobacter aminovorans]SUU88059.1 Probable diguanylate cyclase YdaM [Aminobacter aminovorans]
MLTATGELPAKANTEPQLAIALIVAGIVFLASFFGILTRPVGFLAAVWPANAILLGMMVRNPAFATPLGWLAAFVGYIAADLSTGGNFFVTLWLTIANMTGALTGYLLFRLAPESDRWLQRPASVLHLFAICCAVALAASIAGGGAARLLFGRDFFHGLTFWFITELVNSLIILPVLLTFPGFRKLRELWPAKLSPALLQHALPMLVLAASVALAIMLGGPGALAMPIPALLWCSLTYRTFTTSVLTMLLCTWLLISIPANFIPLPELPDPLRSLDSLRLGIALMALCPLTVASINAARTELIERLSHAANHDSLTGALSRGAFIDRSETCLRINQDRGTSLLMLDIDHFKNVNDRFGHAGGDAMLKEFVVLVSHVLRPADLFGRMGGEEFAVVLPGLDMIAATSVAERIRQALEARAIKMPTGGEVWATVSIGVATRAPGGWTSFDEVMLAADRALYEAKDAGRNMVRVGAQQAYAAAPTLN